MSQFFDLWLDDSWVGMASGDTPTEAREQMCRSYKPEISARVIMTPFYGTGVGRSVQTYMALIGRTPKGLTPAEKESIIIPCAKK